MRARLHRLLIPWPSLLVNYSSVSIPTAQLLPYLHRTVHIVANKLGSRLI